MRIQVVNLPDELIDGELHNRFVLVLDDCPTAGLGKRFDKFARAAGAKGGLVSNVPVEIEEPTEYAELVSDVVRQLDELISRRLDEHQAARRQTWTFTPLATTTNPTTLAQHLMQVARVGR